MAIALSSFNAVLTDDSSGETVRIEQAAAAGSDSVVVLPDGPRYVSSVPFGIISKRVPDKEAEVIAAGIPDAASLCDDSVRQLVVR